MTNMTIRTFINRFAAGDFESKDVETQCEAGWYDWFCRDTSLARKTEALGKKVAQLADSPKINLDTMYVFFKNNCPTWAPLYDDFRICDMETGDVIYTVIPACKAYKGKAVVYGRENGFGAPLVEGTWKDVKKFFLNAK